MQKFFWGLGILLLVSSCKDTSPKQSPSSETAVRKETSGDSSQIFINHITFWVDSTFKKDTSSALHFENQWNDDSLQTRSFNLTQKFLADYRPLLYWSPDSSKILDLNTYGNIAVKGNNGTRLVGGEPDTEVALINVNDKTRTRLIFGGPALNIVSGKWVTNADAVVLGTLRHEKGSDTLLWQINTATNQFTLYNLNGRAALN